MLDNIIHTQFEIKEREGLKNSLSHLDAPQMIRFWFLKFPDSLIACKSSDRITGKKETSRRK